VALVVGHPGKPIGDPCANLERRPCRRGQSDSATRTTGILMPTQRRCTSRGCGWLRYMHRSLRDGRGSRLLTTDQRARPSMKTGVERRTAFGLSYPEHMRAEGRGRPRVSSSRARDGRVLGRPLVQSEDVILSLAIHAQREQDETSSPNWRPSGKTRRAPKHLRLAPRCRLGARLWKRQEETCRGRPGSGSRGS